jgi:hypothetical protein
MKEGISMNQVSWQLYYEERPQTATMTAESVEKASYYARNIKQKLLWEVNNKQTKIYPNENSWELRIINF